MTAAFLVLGGVIVILTALPLLRSQHWFSRGPEFLRLQIAAGALILLVVQLFVRPVESVLHGFSLAILFACLAYQLAWILPYSRLFAREVKSARKPLDESRCISVLAANVLMTNRNVERLAQLIAAADPDIVVLLETNAWWEEHLRHLRETHPHGLDCPLDNRYGMHLYSRLELGNPELRFLVEHDVPSMHAKVRLRSGHCVRFHALHPAPPSPTENPTSRERDAEVLVVARAVAKDPCRVIVTGDFNDVAWSPTTRLFRKVSRLLDPRIGRGRFSTFHARLMFLRFPLDHVFHSDDFTLVKLEVLPQFGSDHLPIHYQLQYEPAARRDQEAPRPDAGDRAEAREKTGKGRVQPEDVPEK